MISPQRLLSDHCLLDGDGMADAVSRYKSGVVASIRAQLSIALHTGMSGKVVKYLAEQGPGQGTPGLAPGVAEEVEMEAAGMAAF